MDWFKSHSSMLNVCTQAHSDVSSWRMPRFTPESVRIPKNGYGPTRGAKWGTHEPERLGNLLDVLGTCTYTQNVASDSRRPANMSETI